MKAYRESTGAYIEVGDDTPVSSSSVQVALRPSLNHVFSDTWHTAPMDPAVCWRLKMAIEQAAEQDSELQAFLDSRGGRVVKSIATVLIQKGVCTLTEIKAAYRSLA